LSFVQNSLFGTYFTYYFNAIQLEKKIFDLLHLHASHNGFLSIRAELVTDVSFGIYARGIAPAR
jgi:hypothetical protein